MVSNLHLLSAVEAVRLLKSGDVSPLELIDVVEARLAATEHLVHATPITCLDRAREAARKLQTPHDPPPGYLWGLPVLIKDLDAVAGVRHTQGSSYFANRIAKRSDPLVQQLEAMGAIVVGKTNTPEFGAGSHTFNDVFPTTVSPYDVRSSAGGSSGGAAASLSACQCWLASGSDLGGSLRTPAAFCGVVGMRCSPGRIARLGPAAKGPTPQPLLGLHSVNGPMARNVLDLALFLDALAPEAATTGGPAVGWEGWQPLRPLGYNSWSEAAAAGRDQGVAQLRSGLPLRVAWSTLGGGVTEEVETLCFEAATRLAAGRPTLRDPPFNLALAERIFLLLRAGQMHATMGHLEPLRRTVKPELEWNIACCGDNLKEWPAWERSAMEEALQLSKQIQTLFEEADILVTPATLDAAFDASIRYPSANFGKPGQRFDDYLAWMRPAYLISITQCPALVLPAGLLPDGRPVGVQLVGRPGGDAEVLAAAAALETALDLDMRNGCPVPRKGNCPLPNSGPRTREEAARHHERGVQAFAAKYGRRQPLHAAL